MWFYAGFPNTSIIVGATAFASLVYHLLMENEPISKGIDICLAYVALVWTIYISIKAMTFLSALSLCAVLFVGLWFKSHAHKTTYESMHSVWHVCVFIGQLLLAKMSIRN